MFKKLKDKSFSQGRIRNYLLYALGEIILVVIGILIALQVNNRNLKSIKQDQELKILKEINHAFISDTTNLQYFSQRIDYNTKAVDYLLQVMESDKAYNDSLDIYFAMVVTPFMWSESNSAYKTLLSKGVDIITNDEIRTDIIRLHTSEFETLKYLDGGVYIKHPYIHEYCLKHFDRVGAEDVNSNGKYVMGRMKPNDYTALKSDPEYRAILKTILSQQKMFLQIIQSTQTHLKETITKINTEINSRQ